MSWWRDRKKLKQARELVHLARKHVRMQRDLMDVHRVEEVTAACDELAMAAAAKKVDELPRFRDKLEACLDKAFPRSEFSAIRENVEVLLVAVIVAMGVRSFFFQPFKIPTGSMHPTLEGIQEGYETGSGGFFLKQIVELVWLGRSYSGGRYTDRGDHIFVDRFTYHFRKPYRGEVVVFATDNIPDLSERSRGKFYIKRLIALPGDKVEIRPPHVLIDGQVLNERSAFKRIYSKQDGYNGYVLPGNDSGSKYIRSAGDFYTVPAHHLFVLGDNSKSSLDGRFWGSFPEADIVGRALVVYWPFTKRFGPIN